ncbi:MAG: hypothetical protein ACK55I_11720, partial [bacterium]
MRPPCIRRCRRGQTRSTAISHGRVSGGLPRSPLPDLRAAFRPRVAARRAENAEEVEHEARQDERHVAEPHEEKPGDAPDDLPLVELPQPWHQEAQHRRQAGAPALHRRMRDHQRAAGLRGPGGRRHRRRHDG